MTRILTTLILLLYIFGFQTGFSQTSTTGVTTETNVLADGTTVLAIHNNSTQNVTAVIFTASLQVTSDTARSVIMRYLDSRQSPWPGVSPGATSQEVVAHNGTSADVTFRAGTLADGTSIGDPAWTQRIPQYRNTRAQIVADVITRLDNTLAGSMAVQTLIQQCQAAIKAGHYQPISPAGQNDWPTELTRYKAQGISHTNMMVVNALSKPSVAASSKSTLDALSGLRATLKQTYDQLTF